MKRLAIVFAVLLSASAIAAPVLIINSDQSTDAQSEPMLNNATIGSDGTTLTTVFDTAVTGSTGITLTPSVGATATPTYSSGSGTDTWTWTIDREVSGAETVTIGYTQAAGNIVNGGTELIDFSGVAVTNNGDDALSIPPELPTATVDITLPAHATQVTPDHTPTTFAALQELLDADSTGDAAAGDVIELDSTLTYSGRLIIAPGCDGSDGNEIIIRSDTYDETPAVAAGTRVTAGDAANMATISGPDAGGSGSEVLTIRSSSDQTGGASHIRFIGVRFDSDLVAADATQTTFIKCGRNASGNEVTDEDDLPEQIVFDRCVFLPSDTGIDVNVCGLFDGRGVGIVECHFDEWHSAAQDNGVCIEFKNGGPLLVRNNYLASSGINIIFGPQTDISETPPYTPHDVVLTKNHFQKDPAWQGTWGCKNLFEHKKVRRLHVYDNVFDESWRDSVTAATQDGCGVVFKGDTYSTDVLFEFNLIKNVEQALRFDLKEGLYYAQRIELSNNLFFNIEAQYSDPATIHFGQWHEAGDDISLRNNTWVIPGGNGLVNFKKSDVGNRMNFIDNILDANAAGLEFFSDGSSTGDTSLNARFNEYKVDNNVLTKFTSGNYSSPQAGSTLTGNNFPTVQSTIDYEDAASDDYRLKVTSPYYQDGTDGDDIGCDVAELNTRISGVE